MIESLKLASLAQLDELWARSHERPVLVFKHSLICEVSHDAYTYFGAFMAGLPSDTTLLCAVVEIQEARDVSNRIAERSGIRHESPQVLLLRDGRVQWHASHGQIDREALESACAG